MKILDAIQEKIQNITFGIGYNDLDLEKVKGELIDLSNEIFRYKQQEIDKVLELPCGIGQSVWVSPNNGKSFHNGILIGVKFNEHNLKHKAFIVRITDSDKRYVDNPISKPMIDYFAKVYTIDEVKEIIKD